MAANQPLPEEVKALAFDVFGTVVDWRSGIEAALRSALREKIAGPSFASLPPDLQQRALALADDDVSLARFAHQWHDAYGAFTKSFVPGTTPWKDVDAHFPEGLAALLAQWQLAGLFTTGDDDDDDDDDDDNDDNDDNEIRALSLAWHRLAPWADAVEGLRRLGARFVTTTLSNGNRALLQDLDRFAGPLGFTTITSAEDFHAYKPEPAVYLGAAEKLGLQPAQVALVAAHLADLQAAKSHGLRTVYVERPQEEAWPRDGEKYRAAKAWVDVWIGQDEDGFRELADRLGL